MTHKKNNSNLGIWIIVGMIAFIAITYLISPQGREIFARSNTTTQIGANCGTSKGCGGGCGGETKTTTTTSSCGAGGCGGGGGCSGNRATTRTEPTINTAVDTTVSYETVNVGHSAYALEPETVTLVAGKSYKVIITPSADGGGCMNNMTIPGLDSNVYPVKKGVPVTIVINNAKAGTYEVVCGNMGMHQGNIVIQ